MTPAICVIVIFLSLTMGVCTAVLVFLTIIEGDTKFLLKGKKILILALLVDAAFVFALQVWRVSLKANWSIKAKSRLLANGLILLAEVLRRIYERKAAARRKLLL